MPKHTPKSFLCKTYDQFGTQRRGCNRKNLAKYDLGEGVIVTLAKETSQLTKYAGWGLKALTDIPKGFQLGYFIQKSLSKTPVRDHYNLELRKGNYFVAEPESLMNKANTIAYAKERKKLTNCKIYRYRGKVGLITTKQVKKNNFLWADYGRVPKHYWYVQYLICKARVTNNKNRKCSKKNEDSENFDVCRGCGTGDELVMCDSCPVSVCDKCLSRKEEYVLCEDLFFCQACLDNPPQYPNRFVKRSN